MGDFWSKLCWVLLWIPFLNHSLDVPHGIVEIDNVNPHHPIIEVHEGGTLLIEIIRRGGCKYPAKVEYVCLDRTAHFERDFKCQYQGPLLWDDGDCSRKSVLIQITDDLEYEEEEEFLFMLESDTSDALLYAKVALGFDRLLIRIPQNDALRGVIEVHPPPPIVEGMDAVFEIRRVDGSIERAAVCYQVWPGTAQLEYDIVYKKECVSWAHLDDKAIPVHIVTLTDELWEDDEDFTVRLFQAEGAALSPVFSEAVGVIQRNNVNARSTADTMPPCEAQKQFVTIDPKISYEIFLQFEVFLPRSDSTVNDAHIVAERIQSDSQQLHWLVLEVEGILIDEMTVSCDNRPFPFEVVAESPSDKPKMHCYDIINSTAVFNNEVEYVCDQKVHCTNFKNEDERRIIDNDTLSSTKQRAVCGDIDPVDPTTILCQCDFPVIWDEDEWVLSDIEIGRNYLSRSVGHDLRRMTQEFGWNERQMATFKLIIRAFNATEDEPESKWFFNLVTDAFPCRQTQWGNWSLCDAQPVGIGHEYRHRLQVKGLPGGDLSCTEQKQHRQCVVNKDKSVAFSTTEIPVKEGSMGRSFTVRLNHELTADALRNSSELSTDQLRKLRAFDVIIYFDVPSYFRKEIVVDPAFVGWQRDKWDLVQSVTITALDDLNIDQLQQTVQVFATIYSVDLDYDKLGEVATVTVIVEDNVKCRHCGMGHIQPFDHVPYPPMWDIKEICIAMFVGIIAIYLCIKGYVQCRRRNSVEYQYEMMKQDKLRKEEEAEQRLNSKW